MRHFYAKVAVLGALALGVAQTPAYEEYCKPIVIGLLECFNAVADNYAPWQWSLMSILAWIVVSEVATFIFRADKPLYKLVLEWVFGLARKVPFVQKKIDQEVNKALGGLKEDLFKKYEGWQPNEALPSSGLSDEVIMNQLDTLANMASPDQRHEEGRVTGTIYVGGKDFAHYTRLILDAYARFAWANPLHIDVFPGVRQMEAEVVRMTCTLFGGDENSCGSHTSGGTESILMAMKAYREYAREKRGIEHPNIVVSRTAHPAFDKAAEYFKLGIRKAEEDPVTRKAIPANYAKLIDCNTIAIVGTCPQYPHGCFDPIPELGKLALEYNVGLHVDCCLGSFVVPFLKEIGWDVPDFDFRVPGVTSISADTHKFGCAPKGSSVVMYSRREFLKFQYSMFTNWPGGVYGTASMAGSRSGPLIASTWTALMHHGYEGYKANAISIMSGVRKIADAIKDIEGIELMCEPEGPVVAWTSSEFDIFRLIEPLGKKKGWDLNSLQFPSGVHFCVTMAHSKEGVIERFIDDLRETTAEVMQNPSKEVSGSAALYGQSQRIPDRSIISDILKGFLAIASQATPDA